MKEATTIRVRYSGLLLFTSKILSLLLGFIFTVYIARMLTKEEYGLWFFIMGLISYFQIIQDILPFWASRDVARGLNVAKTLIVANTSMALIAWLLFLGLSPYFSTLDVEPIILYIGSFFIITYYLDRAFSSIIGAKVPHKLAPRDVIIDTVKIVTVFILIRFRLVGVLIAVLLGQLCYILYSIKVIRPFLEANVNWGRFKRWLKLSWLPLYSYAGGIIYSASDSVLVYLLTSSEALSSYGVAFTIASSLKLTTFLAAALGPKILSTGVKREDIINTYKILLLFLVPMYIGGIWAARDLILIFGSKYIEGISALYILLTNYFLVSLGHVPRLVIIASDPVDRDENVKFRSLLKSNLFRVNTLTYVNAMALIILLFLLIPELGISGAALSILITYVIGVTLSCAVIPGYISIWKIVPIKYMFKCLLATLPMTFVIIILPHGTLLDSLFIILTSASTYFCTLLLISHEVRILLHSFLNELARSLRGLEVTV